MACTSICLTKAFSTTITYLQYVATFLPWIQNLDQSQTPGLFNGSLYHVLTDAYPGGTADVAMYGFNVTCGYIPWSTAQDNGGFYNVSLKPASNYLVAPASGNGRHFYPVLPNANLLNTGT